MYELLHHQTIFENSPLKCNFFRRKLTHAEETHAERWGAEEAKRYDPRTNCLTFKAWAENGYVVRKGEKAIKSFIIVEKKDEKTGEVVERRLKNIFLFYEKQVEKLPA